MDGRPIGIFDSGFGGLSVWQHVRAWLPGESLLYFADGKNCPYGDKPHDQIREYSVQAVAEMIAQGVKLVVMACNTATAAAIGHLRAKYPDIPFVGMEPAVKPAALSSKSGVVAVIATRSSLEGSHFQRTSAEYADRVKILTAVGEGWVRLVESNNEQSAQALERVRAVVEPLVEQGADRIVLGCTHYPFLAGAIREVVGNRDIEIIDSAPAIVRRIRQVMDERGLAAPEGGTPVYSFMTSGDEEYLARLRKKADAARDMAV